VHRRGGVPVHSRATSLIQPVGHVLAGAVGGGRTPDDASRVQSGPLAFLLMLPKTCSVALLRGRRGECEMLDRLLAAVRAGESRALVLGGERRVGQTAL
jgi:hypothetical protein